MRPLETRYALALLELSRNEQALTKGAALLQEAPDLWRALNSPCVSREEKDRVLCRLFEGTAEGEVLPFFRLLSGRERMELLPAIVKEYHRLKLEEEGGAQGVFRCARRPLPEDLARLEEGLKRRRGLSRVELQVELDPELLGGFVLQLQGVTYDKSVSGMLRGLRRWLKERD